MMTCSRSDVFCDWLNVTCSPDLSFISEIKAFLAYNFYPVAFSEPDKGVICFKVGEGILRLECKRQFHSASASGGVIRQFEQDGCFRDYVNILGSVGHNVTRLDAAVDLYTDAPAFLRGLEEKYPEDLFSFGRKALRVTRLYSARLSDLALTGTWYAGHRSSARVTARVYDKQSEAFEKRSEILPPTTRIELTFKKDYNCSLWDVLMPESLFYTHASPKLVTAPSGSKIPVWGEKGLVPWVSTPKDHALTLERFERRVTSSPELLALAQLASELGAAAKPVVMRRFESLFNSLLNSSEDTEVSEDK